jgi:hypothetical protein
MITVHRADPHGADRDWDVNRSAVVLTGRRALSAAFQLIHLFPRFWQNEAKFINNIKPSLRRRSDLGGVRADLLR